MSKTRKTRPLIVKIFDPTDKSVDIAESHSHEDGLECDLPSRKDLKAIIDAHQKGIYTRCDYTFSYVGKNLCGCKQCTGQDDRKIERRKTRHSAKKVIEESINNF